MCFLSIAQSQSTLDLPFDDLQWRIHVSRENVAAGCSALVDWNLLRIWLISLQQCWTFTREFDYSRRCFLGGTLLVKLIWFRLKAVIFSKDCFWLVFVSSLVMMVPTVALWEIIFTTVASSRYFKALAWIWSCQWPLPSFGGGVDRRRRRFSFISIPVMCWCLRRHGDVLVSGFRGFPADGDASANATTSVLSRLVVVPARELIRFIDIYFCRIFSFYLFISRSRWSSMGLMFDRFGYLAVSFEFQTESSGLFPYSWKRKSVWGGLFLSGVAVSVCIYMVYV